MKTVNVKRNMKFQIDYCKEVLELLDTKKQIKFK